jgi:hypothetical protein
MAVVLMTRDEELAMANNVDSSHGVILSYNEACKTKRMVSAEAMWADKF